MGLLSLWSGKPAKLLVREGYNHFELLETLASPYGFAGRAALEQMQLVPLSNFLLRRRRLKSAVWPP